MLEPFCGKKIFKSKKRCSYTVQCPQDFAATASPGLVWGVAYECCKQIKYIWKHTRSLNQNNTTQKM